MFSEKADGVRYLLVLCTVHLNGAWRRLSIFYGRNHETIIVPLVIGERLFTHQCVFDGELVKTWRGQWLFLVFDTYMYEGMVTIEKPFVERSIHTQCFVDENYAHMPGDVLCIQTKRFSSLRNANFEALEAIMDNNASTKLYAYPTDGLILVQATAPAHAGTNKSMFKFKKVHTIDLRIMPHPDDSDDGFTLCSSTIDARSGNVSLTSHVALNSLPDGVHEGDIIECALTWDDAEERMDIEPLHVRRDKVDSNATWVVERTIQTVRDALTIESIMRA